MEKDFNYYKALILEDKLPKDFDQWLIKNEHGDTIAHEAANKGILPPDWTNKTEDWLIKNSVNDTIAHLAAYSGILPPDWTNNVNDWTVEDNYDRSIAHCASLTGILPLNWTQEDSHWLIRDALDCTIGFYYCNQHKQHYNNPQTLEDYCLNIKNHTSQLFRSNSEHGIRINIEPFFNFFEPFLNIIKQQSQEDWMRTSDEYSGFLIDYVESIMSYIPKEINFHEIVYDHNSVLANQIKDNIEKTHQYIQDEKFKIKEKLFAHHESKKQSIIQDNEYIPDLSESL